MGGRGSSGVTGSRGSKNAVDQKMPDLTGSEKQVRWANEIRQNMLSYADANVRNAKQNEKINLRASYIATVDATEWVRNYLVNELKTITSASKIIDKRDKITQSYLEKLAIEYERRKKK